MLKPGLTIAAALLLATGCASGAGTQRLEREGNASLTGVIVAPPSAVRQETTSCAGVRVHVAHISEPSRPLGTPMVKQSRGRCLYVVSNLPSDAVLQLEVSPASSWRCGEGQAPTLKPKPGAFKLRDYETATRDFRALCD
jgi:hypothetical protein